MTFEALEVARLHHDIFLLQAATHLSSQVRPFCCITMQVTKFKPEIWNEAAWQPAFAELVQSYHALVHCTQLGDQVLASVYEALLSSIVAVESRKRFAGKAVLSNEMDDILLEQCNQFDEIGANTESLSDSSEKSLLHTFSGPTFSC